MQFVENGPDIPDSLLQAHEEGRVVFFCGSGISYPAGLPLFKGLVDKIYASAFTTRQPIEDEAYGRSQYDATLNLLEQRLPDGRLVVRRALVDALKPDWTRPGATDTHDALLHLSRSPDGALRLVTTNFDRIFEHVGSLPGRAFRSFAAPMLPIPKNRWDGLVYLHGLLPETPDESSLHRLVLTSGDFGLAYLNERWASRFASELFRNYVVCFVGYSINDPVLRYMMDALAADRRLGENTPQAYAFGDCEPGHEKTKTIEWNAKGVTPVLYTVRRGTNDHSVFHKTLKAWAETYRDGVLGRERIVVEYGMARPTKSTKQDDFVGRMIWALTHDSGLPARRFAELNPVPSLEWLIAFTESCFKHGDLSRFKIPPKSEVDEKLSFSLARRPSPYTHSPWMMLVSSGFGDAQLDGPMIELGRWLIRHLNDAQLVVWVAQHGGVLNPTWAWMIERELKHLAQLETDGDHIAIEAIRADAPNAIPNKLMRTLWRVVLTGRLKTSRHGAALFSWTSRLKYDGLTTTLRLELKELLSPRIAIGNRLRLREETDEANEPTNLNQLVHWELRLAEEGVIHTLRDLKSKQWEAALPTLLDDVQQLLRDAVDLAAELDGANEHDRSIWDMPSISEHWQNRYYRDWVALIQLTRDAWLATVRINLERARKVAEYWYDTSHIVFKRLALFAASQDGCVPPAVWINWLLEKNALLLWSVYTKRETMRLLVLQAKNLSPEEFAKIEFSILGGPPREMVEDELEAGKWQAYSDRQVCVYLYKLREGRGVLSEVPKRRLAELCDANPEWKPTNHDRDEFSHWMSGTGDPDYEPMRQVEAAPLARSELVQWLKQERTGRGPFYEDTWFSTCQDHVELVVEALQDLAAQELWPLERWNEAFQAWTDATRAKKAWNIASSLIQQLPEIVMLESAHSLTAWLQSTSDGLQGDVSAFLNVCEKVLALELKADSGMTKNGAPINEPVMEAINHPVGHVTSALVNIWLSRNPSDGQLLPGDIKPLFTKLSAPSLTRFRHGRVILASRLISIFRVDRAWTERFLLPLFDWDASFAEAKGAWEGFLWSPRLYRPLQLAYKTDFLATAQHYDDLGEHRRQFAAFFTYAALDPSDGFSTEDFRKAFSALPLDALTEVAGTMVQAVQSAGERRSDYYANRIKPFWQFVWPKDANFPNPSLAYPLARLCVAAGSEFPSALAMVIKWLLPFDHPSYFLQELRMSELCAQFPGEALTLLDTVIRGQLWFGPDLQPCLAAIVQTMPAMRDDKRYRRLADLTARG